MDNLIVVKVVRVGRTIHVFPRPFGGVQQWIAEAPGERHAPQVFPTRAAAMDAAVEMSLDLVKWLDGA